MEAEYCWLYYNTDEDPAVSILRQLTIEDGVGVCQVLQGVHETAPIRGPVVVQHDRGSCSEIVKTETSSIDSSAASTATTTPNVETPTEYQDGTSSASPGTVTWSQLYKGFFVCHLCRYSSLHLSEQMRHSRTHIGERTFSCDLCPQSFKQRSHLEYHRGTHTRDRAYVCTICRAPFTTNRSLNQHMRIHTEERP